MRGMRLDRSFLELRGHFESLPIAWLVEELRGIRCIALGRAAPELSAVIPNCLPIPGCHFDDNLAMISSLAGFINQPPLDRRRFALVVTDLDIADQLLIETNLMEAIARASPFVLMPSRRRALGLDAWWGQGFSYPEQNETGVWRWTDCDPIAGSMALKCSEAAGELPAFVSFEMLTIEGHHHDVHLTIGKKHEIISFTGRRKVAAEIEPGSLIEISLASERAPRLTEDARKLGVGISNMSIQQVDGTVLLSCDQIYRDPDEHSEFARRQFLHRAGFSHVRSRWAYPGGLFGDLSGVETVGTPEIGLTSVSRETLFRCQKPPGDPECWLLASWYANGSRPMNTGANLGGKG